MKLVYQLVVAAYLLLGGVYCEDELNPEITTLFEKISEEEIAEVAGIDIRNNLIDDDDGEEKPDVLESTMVEKRIERVEDPSLCYHVDIKVNCFEKVRNSNGSCECEELDEGNIVCCNVTDIAKSIACLGNISLKNIHIINMMEDELNLSTLNVLKQTDSLAITDGNITKISGSFTKFTGIKCLSLASNKIIEINDRALVHTNQLKSLNLSKNNITRLPTVNNITVNVQGNPKISCNNILDNKQVKFVDTANSYCERETVYTWFNDTAPLTILALEKMKKLNEECPQECKCEPSHMYYRNLNLEVTAKVDCASQNLINFPKSLPPETVELIVSNNSISSLAVLIDNESYQNVQRLYIDDNKIDSIEILDGSRFFENFTILSLKNNKIQKIPNYILSNLEKNLNSGKSIYLGGNRLTCDCLATKNIRYWRLINDGGEILCNNMQSKVSELKESQMCKQGVHDWSTYINIIIGIEIVLLIALFTKVSYDYYMFKKTGFLPYPASFIILYNQK